MYNYKNESKLEEDGMKILVGIIGVTGYTGGELLRLLISHPFV